MIVIIIIIVRVQNLCVRHIFSKLFSSFVSHIFLMNRYSNIVDMFQARAL